MRMNHRGNRILLAGMLLVLVAGVAAAQDKQAQQAAKGVNVGGGEMGISAIIIEGPPITAEQVMSSSHAKYPRGMTCAECHDVTFDGMTSATRQFINNFPRLTQEQIWEKILAFLPGRERFAITTVANNEPTATTVDMVLDPAEQVLYVVSEKGTEKLLEIRKNPAISAVRFAGWTVADGGKKEWRSVQIRGKAELLTAEDPSFMPTLEKYSLVRVTKERAQRRFDIIRVTPEQIIYFDTTLSADEYSPYQLWKRGKTGVISD